MAGKVVWGLLAGLAVAVLSLGARAAEPPKGDGPAGISPGNPEVLFKRLDKNHDGAISPDEIPPGAPERLIALLKKADKNGDKKLTLDELKEAWKAGPPGPPWAGAPKHGPPPGPNPPQRPFVGPPHAKKPVGAPPHGAGPFPAPDLNALFTKMDKNHDGSLSLDEFVAGTTALHPPMMKPGPMGPAGPPHQPGPGMAHQPGPGMPHHPGPAMPHQPGPGKPHGVGQGPGLSGPPGFGGFGFMGGPGPGHTPPAGCPCPGCRFGQPAPFTGFGPGPQPSAGGPAAGHAGPPWRFAGPWHGPRGMGHGPGPRPEMRPPFARPGGPGGPGEDHLRRLVARLVREELDKIAKEKVGAPHGQPPRPGARPEPKR